MSVTINGTSGLVFNDASTQNTAATGFGFKNRIINGAMMIDQRNAGASVAIPANTTTYTIDRWNAYATQASKFIVQQSSTATTGFVNSLACTSSSAYSVLTGDYFVINQRIEGLNITDLGWGTANASAVTLGFWVRSSLTGTFGGAIQNSAQDRSYPFSFTISSANTMEYKTITIAGDTSGTWLTTNGVGMRVFFNLGSGSTYSGTANTWAGAAYFAPTGATSVVGTSGATFYITGVQLEKGSTATSFDYRPIGTELALCQRYAYVPSGNSGVAGIGVTTFVATQRFSLPVQMRSAPTFSIQTSGSYVISDDYSADITAASISVSTVSSSQNLVRVGFDGFSGLTIGRFYGGLPSGGTAKLLFSAEL